MQDAKDCGFASGLGGLAAAAFSIDRFCATRRSDGRNCAVSSMKSSPKPKGGVERPRRKPTAPAAPASEIAPGAPVDICILMNLRYRRLEGSAAGGGLVSENRSNAQQKTEWSQFGEHMRRGANSGASIPSIGEIGLNQFATYLMNRVIATWNGQMQDALRDYDLTTVKMRTLAVLAITPGLTVNELSMFTVTEQSTMSRMLDAMEEQGLIRRQAREDDLRVREVHPTNQGREAFSRFWPKMYDSFTKLFQGIEEEEYQAFVVTLHKLIRNQQSSNA
jgi:MarR family transcriptional regulator, transcriptional regulator for hemolysin